MLNPLLMSDVYKLGHLEQYCPGTNKVYSYFCNRSSRTFDKHVFFGLQYYLEKYLSTKLEPWMAKDFVEVYESMLGPCPTGTVDKINALVNLGYFPLEIKALPEGVETEAGVPLFTIQNTIPGYHWVVGFVESVLLKVWYSSVVATTSRKYKKLVEDLFTLSVDDDKRFLIPFMVHDFGYRGDSSEEGAALSGCAHLLNFVGSDTIPAFRFSQKYYGADLTDGPIMLSVPACYSDDTEILTENGFKKFQDLDIDEKVAQYNNGDIEFVIPKDYIRNKYEGKMVSFYQESNHSKYSAVVTPNHRMVRMCNNKVDLFEAGDYTTKGYGNHYKYVVSGNSIIESDCLSDYEKLLIAFQADGSYSARCSEYSGERTGSIAARFSLKKERKADRLKNILDNLGLEYSENKYENGYYSFRVAVPCSLKLEKTFSWVNLKNKSASWASEFIEELSFWDGSKSRNSINYSSIIMENITMVQAIAAICGKRATFNKYEDSRSNRQPIYSTTISDAEFRATREYCSREEINYDGYVYCVSVPSKMIIIRHNGNVMVCGNSEHSVACSFGRDGELDYINNMLDKYPTGIVSIVSDQYDVYEFFDKYLREVKDKILSREGKTVLRPDSGSQYHVICGYKVDELSIDSTVFLGKMKSSRQNAEMFYFDQNEAVLTKDGKYYDINLKELTELEVKGCLQILDDIFGHTMNSKGYKVLNSKIGLIYGDGMYYEKYKEVQERLLEMGYSAENLIIGVGGILRNHSRDTLGCAIKATSIEVNGEQRNIFKDPITDKGKKSACGLLKVFKENNQYKFADKVSEDEEKTGELKTVFLNGQIKQRHTLQSIRDRLC